MIEGNRVAHVPSKPEDSEVTTYFPQNEAMSYEDGAAIMDSMHRVLEGNDMLVDHYPGSEFTIDPDRRAIGVISHFNDVPLELAEEAAVDAAHKAAAEHSIDFEKGYPERVIHPLGRAGLERWRV